MPCDLPAVAQLSQGGCQLCEGRDGFEFEAEDPRRLRWVLPCMHRLVCSRRHSPLPACRQLLRLLPGRRGRLPGHLHLPGSSLRLPLCHPGCSRLLEQKLTLNSQLRGGFLEGLQEQLAEPAALHAALRPMAVTGVGSDVGGHVWTCWAGLLRSAQQ